MAGAASEIFAEEALREVHRCTKGYPGLINGLCDFAMFFGHNMGLAEIGAEAVLRSGASLRLPGEEQECDAAEETDAGPAGNGTAPAGTTVQRCGACERLPGEAGEGGQENTAAEEVVAALTEGEGQEPGRSPDATVAGMPETAARRGRFAVISSFGALAAVVLLVGGMLYYRHVLDAAWTPPAEPPSAGPPVPVAGALQPDPGQVLPAAKTVVSSTGGQDRRETASAGEVEKSRLSPPSLPVAPAPSGINGMPAASTDAAAGAAETATVPEEAAGSAPPVGDEVAQQAPGPASGDKVPGDTTAGQEARAEEGPPTSVETAAAPISAPVPEQEEPARSSEPLSPALKALLAGGSLAGDSAIRRLPDVRINSAPNQARPPEIGRGGDEPDPAQVIDWLLKKKSGHDPSR